MLSEGRGTVAEWNMALHWIPEWKDSLPPAPVWHVTLGKSLLLSVLLCCFLPSVLAAKLPLTVCMFCFSYNRALILPDFVIQITIVFFLRAVLMKKFRKHEKRYSFALLFPSCKIYHTHLKRNTSLVNLSLIILNFE